MLRIYKLTLASLCFSSSLPLFSKAQLINKEEIQKSQVKIEKPKALPKKKIKSQIKIEKPKALPKEKKKYECSMLIFGTDRMQFVDSKDKMVREIKVPHSCKKFTFKFSYKGTMSSTIMGHNIIVTEESHRDVVSSNALKQGKKNNYLPDNSVNSHVIAASTKTLGGGAQDFHKEDIIVTMSKVDPNKKYTYFCSFPGHSLMMKGSFKREKAEEKKKLVSNIKEKAEKKKKHVSNKKQVKALKSLK